MYKKHYKMYKDGKHWVVAAVIAAVGAEITVAFHEVHAATINNKPAVAAKTATTTVTNVTNQSSQVASQQKSLTNSQVKTVTVSAQSQVSQAKQSSQQLVASQVTSVSAVTSQASSVNSTAVTSQSFVTSATNKHNDSATVSQAPKMVQTSYNTATSMHITASVASQQVATSVSPTISATTSDNASQAASATSVTSQSIASQQSATSNVHSSQTATALDLVSQQASTHNMQSNVNNNNQQTNIASQANNPVAKAQSVSLAASTAVLTLGDSNAPRMDAIDLSSWNNNGQTITVDQFRYIKSCGVKTIIVKLTEGNYYTWSGALADIRNAQAAGLNVSVYHFAHYNSYNSAINEANYFANAIDSLGLSKNIVVVDDLEANDTNVNNEAYYTQVFFNQLANRGYHNHVLYTFVSYGQRANVVNAVGADHVWMAQYPYTPSKDSLWNTQYGAWQFSCTTTIQGLAGYFDVSIDYKNIFGDNTPQQVEQNGKWYLEQNGKKLTGFQQVPGQNKTCYYDPNNGGAMVYGQQYINGHWYLFDQNTGAMQTGWQTVYDGSLHRNKDVWYNAQGQMAHGLTEVSN
ncbi:MAG: KxYKxGKxW signal peptide domain-containing protein, partial [Candidatus Paralactobacillus gallistercoris]|nr:KxYKxGKxW signal peptide domain-containing protein [Candidatus Paralactobacillus gallistercoris]